MSSQNKVKVAVASTATIARDKVIPAFRKLSDSIEIVGVGSRSVEKAVDFCKENDAGKPMSYEEMLKSDADAFYIPLPSGVRNDFIRKSIQEGNQTKES